jgi:hypothetical protein
VGVSDEDIAISVGVGGSTVYRTKRRFVEGNLAAALSEEPRTYAVLVEALNKHRGKGQQKIIVQHVHVNEGGQAIVGDISHGGGGDEREKRNQPQAIGHSPGAAMRCPDAEREAVPVAGHAERPL